MNLNIDKSWSPQSCQMEDLSNLTWNSLETNILNATFRGGASEDGKSRLLINTYIRQVNQAISEYQGARNSVINHIDSKNEVLVHIFIALNHFESLITILKRSFRLIQAIKRNPNCPKIDKYLSVFSNNVQNRITEFRNSIEHMDSLIIDPTRTIDLVKTIRIDCDRIELAGIEIKYSELSSWIRHLDRVANKLAHFSWKDGIKSINDNKSL